VMSRTRGGRARAAGFSTFAGFPGAACFVAPFGNL